MGKRLCCVVLFGLLATTGWCELLNGDFEYWSDHPDDPIWAYITTIQDDPAVGWYAHEDVDGWADPWIDDGYGGYEHIVGTNGDRVLCISWGDPLAVVSQNLGIAFVQGQTYTFSLDIFGDGAGGEHWCLGIGTEGMSNLNAAERQRDALALAASNALVGEKWALGDESDYTVLDPPDTFAGWQTRTVSYTATARDAGKEIVVFLSGGFVEVASDNDTCFDNATFTFEPLDPAQAAGPDPADGAVEVSATGTLGWAPGIDADTHDVYFGTVFDDVNDADRSNPMGVLVSQGQDAATYDPEGLLEFSRTYYWRVDEIRAAPGNAVIRGKVWSFTIEPLAYPIADISATASASDGGSGPEKTIDGSGLNESDQHSINAPDMWLAAGNGVDPVWIQYEFDRVYKLHEMLVWNYNVQFEPMLGLGLKNVAVEYSENGTDWMTLGDVEFAQATAKPDYSANTIVDLGGAAAQYVRLTVNSGFGMMGQFGLSEIRFMYIPAHARDAQPVDGAAEVDVNTILSWRAGRETVSHEVYLSTEEQGVIEGTALVDTVAEAEYAPSDLEFGSTYYWKVNEVNEADEIRLWEGDVWDFMTQEFAPIDDMEDYDDEENRIYDTWLDGWANETGSTVGYIKSPFAEQTIVNHGRQSMPLEYDNSGAPFYSEAEKDLGSLSLNSNGADSLRLFVAGLAPDFFETADGSILMNAMGVDIWGTIDQFRFAYRSLTGDGSMIARVDGLDAGPSSWVKAGVMIRQGTGSGSQHSFMCITGGEGNGASWQGRLNEGQSSVNSDATDPVAPPYWVKIERSGNDLIGALSADGENWTQIGDPRTVEMDDPVLIGLALTSHNANQATGAEFSNVSTTGNIAGAWQIEEIGVPQPEGNRPGPVFVALEDASGKVAVVTHPDPLLSGRFGWTEWVIPYGELSGINLGSVNVMYIGVGDRDNPSAGGAGLIFVDDIGYGRPAPAVE